MALAEARKAELAGEIPIGAVLVHQNKILAKSHNQTELLHDVTAHAEMLAMCAGALRWSQLSRLVYGAEDEKLGFMRYGKDMLHPKTQVEYGLCSEEASDLLKKFFRDKRLLKS